MSDHNERPCQKCGSLTHHENDCNDELDRLRQENERLKGEVEDLKGPHNDQIWHLTQERDSARGTVSMWLEANGPGGWIDNLRSDLQLHKQALEKARDELKLSDDLLGEIHAYGNCDCCLDNICIPCQCGKQRDGNAACLTTINNVLKEGK